MYNQKRGEKRYLNKKIIPIVGLGILILISLGLFQIVYYHNFDDTPKEVLIELQIEATNPWSELEIEIDDQSYTLNSSATKSDSLTKILLIPKQSYQIRLKLDDVKICKKDIIYFGEPNLLIYLKIVNDKNSVKVDFEMVEFYRDLLI